MTLGAPKPDDFLYRLLIGHDSAGRPVFAPPYASVLATGAPRTGKSRNVAIPAIASYHGTTVVVSVRGDVYEQTRESRTRRGPVAVFDPAGLVPDSPYVTGWDLLAKCRDFQFAVDLAQSLADAGVPKNGGGNSDWAFWASLGRKVVAPCLFAAARNGYGIDDVVRFIQTREEFEVRSLLRACGDEGDRALQMIQGIWENEQRLLGSVYATADAMISGFEAPSLAAAVKGGLDLDHFLNIDGSTLYVIAPATHQSVYAPVVTSLIGAALDVAVEKAEATDQPARILVVIDEAGNVGNVPELRSRTSTSMGFGVTMMVLTQDVSALRRVYAADDTQSILGNVHVLMGLKSTDIHTANFFDQLIGSDPHESLPNGAGVARMRRIPPGHAITMVGGDEPRLLKLPSLDDPLLRMELEAREEEPELMAAPKQSPKPKSDQRPKAQHAKPPAHAESVWRGPMSEAETREMLRGKLPREWPRYRPESDDKPVHTPPDQPWGDDIAQENLGASFMEEERAPIDEPEDGAATCAWRKLDPIDALPPDDIGHYLASRDDDDAEADYLIEQRQWEQENGYDDEPPENPWPE